MRFGLGLVRLGLGLGLANPNPTPNQDLRRTVEEVVGAQDALGQRQASVRGHSVRPQRAWLGLG